MRTRFRSALAIAILGLLVQISSGQQRLLVVGGGARPPEAIKKFVEWSGGVKSRILVITWASGVPDESFEALRRNFSEAGSVDHAAIRPLDGEKRAKFIAQLKETTGIFFSGGDQNRIMDVLKDEELLGLIRAKYTAGTPMGGTSAGAAVISDPMMTGEADLKIFDGAKVGVRPGLGLVPEVMFDQHFLVRQRHNRLFGFVMQNPKYLGVGIDEDTAVLIEDNRRVQTVGKTRVMFVDARKRDGSFIVYVLKSGEVFDLKKRKPVR